MTALQLGELQHFFPRELDFDGDSVSAFQQDAARLGQRDAARATLEQLHL
jgi:hypothetical protein